MLISLAQNIDRLQPISLKRCGREVPFKLSYALLPHIQSVWSRCWGPTIVVALVLLSVADKVLYKMWHAAGLSMMQGYLSWDHLRLAAAAERIAAEPEKDMMQLRWFLSCRPFFPPSIHLPNRTNATCLNQARARAAGCGNQCSWN